MSLFSLSAYGFAAVAVYYICPKRFRWIVLLLVSYGFYASKALSALPFILLTTLSTWLGARVIDDMGIKLKAELRVRKASMTREEKTSLKAQTKKRQRACLCAVLAINFTVLAVFKYTDDLLGMVGASPLGLLLPLGISFYTFQATGYLLDVYGGKYASEKNPAKFALFVSFFPQLIQGPIGRYDQLAPQLQEPHDFDWDQLQSGFLLMLWGLFKKMVIADRALPAVDAVFSAQAGEYGGAIAVLSVLLYSLQQYCDFSGGIDLVSGIAQQMGIRLAPNFRRPYFAVSLGDFWRRWHISLGSWMRDYVFYPFALTKPVGRLSDLAKARFGTAFARALPAALGNVLVFFLVGLWHGATSNYIFWGLYNGLILAFSALMEPCYKRMNGFFPCLTSSRGFHIFRVLRTFVIVNIGWFFDRALHASDAVVMMKAMLMDFRAGELLDGTMLRLGIAAVDYGVLAASALLVFAVSLVQEKWDVEVRGWIAARALPIRWLLMIAGVLCILLLGKWGSGFSEASFIYYQF